MNFKQWLEAYRIDKEKITDFAQDMKSYYHNSDFTKSGTFQNEPIPSDFNLQSKGLFAGENLKDIIPYAVPRNTSWILAHKDSKRPTLYLLKKDQKEIKNYKPWLTKFDDKNFKKLQSGELFTQKPNSPVRQEKIRNSINFIKQWMNIQFVDDLDYVANYLNSENIPFDSEGYF
jgi:hypothetical protein